ncbi:MAG: glycine zipper family protein [Geobacteraceae bacterium]
MVRRIIAALILPVFIISGCASYKTQHTGFRPPAAYPGNVDANRVAIGGEAYVGKAVAKEAFGFDIRDAGLLPVQLVMDNKSGNSLELVSSQTFLVDDNGRYWNVILNRDAVERVDKYTEMGAFLGKGAGKGAILGAVAGTILGAAIGIVSGRNVGTAIGKGAAIGAAGGALIGGTKEGTSSERPYRIADDIRDKGLEGKVIPDEHLANGFIFFPGEAPSAKELRLQYRENETGKLRSVVLKLK